MGDAGAQGSTTFADPPLRVVLSNLAFITVLAVLVGLWVGYFTDWLPVMVTLLSLGGMFGVAGVVVALLPKAFKERIQQLFLVRVLGSPSTWKVVAAAYLAALLTTSFWGSVRVVFRPNWEKRDIWIEPTQVRSPQFHVVDDSASSIPASSGVPRKFPQFTLWPGRAFRVRLDPSDGLPSQTVRVKPFQRVDVAVPNSFLNRRRILLRPSPFVAMTAKGNPYTLKIWIDNRELKPVINYRGQAVWIGSDAEDVPPELEQRWQSLGLDVDAIALWKTPVPLADISLEAGSVIKAELITAENTRWELKTHQEPDLPSQGRMFKEIILDEP